MKALALSFSLLFLCSNLFAQDTTYYEDHGGKRFDIGHKINGNYNGEVITYDRYWKGSPRLRCKTDYVNGKKEGIQIMGHILPYEPYTPDGFSIISFRNDIKEGPCIWFNQDATVRHLGQFLNDKECGIWYEYYQGKLTSSYERHEGDSAEQETYFFPDGRVSQTGFADRVGIKKGLWLEFDSAFTSFMIGEYTKDSTIRNYPDSVVGGVRSLRITESFSKKIGVWKTYNFKGELISEKNYDAEERKNKLVPDK